jgi:hypothetical protein
VIYPNSTPEFRIVIKQDDTEELQVRYVNSMQGYTSKWQAVEKVKLYEDDRATSQN